MLLSTPALVLHTIPHGDTSVVARLFTRALGVRSYIIKGARARNGRVRMNVLQPLSCLEAVVYDSPRATLHHVRELRPAPMLPRLAADPLRTSLVFFMDEVLDKVLREAEPNVPLFDYIVQELKLLDASPEPPHPASPIHFLIAVAHHLGVAPLDNFSPLTPRFSLEEGQFVASSLCSPLVSDHASLLLHRYLSGESPSAPLAQRKEIINLLIKHLQTHLFPFPPLQTPDVLHSLLV